MICSCQSISSNFLPAQVPFVWESCSINATACSTVRFSVYRTKSTDEDDDGTTARTIVPFQIAYAVSIHKAQGLEYRSVKIVITDEVDELITHNIFYTAITRAQNKEVYI